ncbi:MAG: hypothetical protein JWO08_574 [Verrucomicrobiaceae bacterium]|nr:hypothetical protein [Verrucomicrobiaceae bacterium]
MLLPALSSLGHAKSALIQSQLAAWNAGASDCYRQIAENIANETALSVAAFATLLDNFVNELALRPAEPEKCWEDACHANQWQGHSLSPPSPERLGRAIPINTYAEFVSKADGLMSPDECGDFLRWAGMAGTVLAPSERRLLQKSLIGRFVIWATFYASSTTDCPFIHMPRTTEAVRTALGLGQCSETETLILLSYHRGTLALYRPTVAEAAGYHWYRPRADPAATYGMSFPLTPNPSGLPSQPEVVHPETTGATLVFPVYLVT